jgi:hypothetical protein
MVLPQFLCDCLTTPNNSCASIAAFNQPAVACMLPKMPQTHRLCEGCITPQTADAPPPRTHSACTCMHASQDSGRNDIYNQLGALRQHRICTRQACRWTTAVAA